jgi:hypothetical protein
MTTRATNTASTLREIGHAEEIVTVGDDGKYEASDDPDAVVVETAEAGVSEQSILERSAANARKKVHGSKK